jgi:hypothetical protein
MLLDLLNLHPFAHNVYYISVDGIERLGRQHVPRLVHVFQQSDVEFDHMFSSEKLGNSFPETFSFPDHQQLGDHFRVIRKFAMESQLKRLEKSMKCRIYRTDLPNHINEIITTSALEGHIFSPNYKERDGLIDEEVQ